MTRGDEHRLADLLDAVDYEAWLADEDLRLVTERLMEIVGEAARAMSDAGRTEHPGVDWAGLGGLRNVLVHAYHRIQPDLRWQAATVEVPAVAALLRAQA
ncbi:HepT-like ribonuclease domain-containing protein [Pseudonocardia abyssalis]|uniref:DUF86 domain-containing protein n=1 Tax=Pseudonocardia abyssalis TaxID=2792008 RepID=A0ABS6UWQ7_9PSEU|nr:HepT-like ribonuclease domain-containing protein [Pseudonocardia abyssalis]MBW0114682.1 DUF86 domain-containing protein [Pseudonocardia abyssalis]MBW0136677.1 DUF86 domain-containing protein [Pseudonocardia abyssalis]